MTSIHAALVRLNVAPQKLGFWEVQLENSIKRAEFLSDFDAEQVSKEKQVTKSELSNFERAIRAGTRALMLQKRFANLSQPTVEIINSQLSVRSNDRVNFEDLDLDYDDQRQVLRDAINGSKKWLHETRGLLHGVKATEIVNATVVIYKQITGKEPGVSSTSTTSGKNYTTPFEQLLIECLNSAGVTISAQGARALYLRVYLKKK
ncbi:MAG: Uncharacterised protein [Halieaceae bacterium]|jgi:hypothetical protein|nr:MAG: Uncharacterised protein [Halieaceae bacterium]|tara:strand:+ start:145 stop:759 length:615 start_codon:yes stop_codon:yes gene_type:complete